MAFFEVPVVFLLDNDGYFLSRRHVAVGQDLERGRLSIEEPIKFT